MCEDMGEEGGRRRVWVCMVVCACAGQYVSESVCVMHGDRQTVIETRRSSFRGVGVLSQLGQGKRPLPGTVPCGAFLWRPGDPNPFPACVLS